MRNTEPEVVAEFAANLAKSDPKIAGVISDAQKLDHLREDPGWILLKRRILEAKDTFMSGIAKGLMSGNIPNQRQIDYYRGYFQGSLDVVEMPEKAAKNLERAARDAWLLAQVEEETGEQSPYN